MPDTHYYKFRSLQNIRRFLDILLNNRLYAAHYEDLNDPMEGQYLIDSRHKDVIRLLKIKKYKTRICSLSKNCKHTLLWSHYADSHKGCCLEISPLNTKDNLVDVNYQDHLPEVTNGDMEGRYLLSHKSKLWEYENEARFFSKSKCLKVKIHRIIFGCRVPDGDFNFYKKLISAINSDIKVTRISEEEIDDGYSY